MSSNPTPFHIACARGEEQTVRGYIAQCSSPADLESLLGDDVSCGATPAHIASQYGHSEILRILLEAKADVEGIRPDKQATSLMMATIGGKLDCMRLLLDQKANPNWQSPVSGAFPLYMAAQTRNVEAMKLLIEVGRVRIDATLFSALGEVKQTADVPHGVSTLCLCAQDGFVEGVQMLLQYGADVHLRRRDTGACPLFCAAGSEMGDTGGEASAAACVLLLLEAKAHPDKDDRSSDGATPLMNAAIAGNTSAARILIEAKADVMATTKDADSASPLALASQYGRNDIVTLLIRSEAFIDYGHRNTGVTPLILAAMNGHGSAVETLLEARANVNAAAIDSGATPLLMAAQEGYLDVVRRLLDHSGDPNPVAKHSKATALGIARARGHVDVANLLESRGGRL